LTNIFQDVANVDHIECTTHYSLVDQSPSEQAIYLELVQHLAATDFIIVRINPSEGDRAKQIQDVASGSGDGKPALFMRASHFTFEADKENKSASDLCKAIMENREAERDETLASIERELKRTYWLHVRVDLDRKDGEPPCHHFTSFRNRISTNQLGDLPTTKRLSEAIVRAVKGYNQNDWKIYYRAVGSKIDDKNLPEYPTGQNASHGVTHVTRMAFELRTWATRITKFTTRLVRQERSLRFIENVRHVQCGDPLSCSHCGISNLQPADVKVMAQCGHLLAVNCCSGNDCPVNGCNAFNREYQKIIGSGFGQAKFDSCSKHGSKMDAVLELIQQIIEDKNEKVLVFIQHKQSTDKLEAALTAAGIAYSDLRKETTSSDVLDSFQRSNAPKNGRKPSKVLILNIGDANASGR
jgi:SNF2 family DNA or RNA helicase